MSEFLKGFNALQITAGFAVFPFLLLWLRTAQFTASWGCFFVGIIVYVIFFCVMIGCVFNAMFEK